MQSTYLHSQPHVHFPGVIWADMFFHELGNHTKLLFGVHLLQCPVVIEVYLVLFNL